MDALSLQADPSTNAQNALAAKSFARKPRTDADFDKTAKDFEGVFMAQMLQPMFESVGVDDIFGGGHGEEMVRGMLTQEYGKAVAAADKSGLSDAIKDQMIRLQEKANKGAVA
jgi:Rod binding domain-containing protein